MRYNKKFKLRIIRYYKAGNLSISDIARKEQIPKQTVARWIKLYSFLGGKALENKKPGAKEIPINHEYEKIVLFLWKKGKRSVYTMRKELKKYLRKNGHTISERQIKKIYLKNKLQVK